jgi:uncharacterized membrane protein
MPEATDVVRARPITGESMAVLWLREQVLSALWFLPSVFVVGAVVLSQITVGIDRGSSAGAAPSWLVGADPGAAISLTSTVAQAMLAFIGVVFSSTLIAIQLAGGQYSPRVVRLFVRSRLTHFTLATFLATFVFALNALVEIRASGEDFIPTVTMAVVHVLLIATLFTFVAFVHGFVRMLRVQYLLRIVTRDGRRALDQTMPGADAYRDACGPVTHDVVLVRNTERSGVLQAMDLRRLAKLAAARDGWVELLVEVGEYVGIGSAVARLHGQELAPDDPERVTSAFLLGGERTTTQDPGFVFRQIVDVAIRALSPAVNDPTTAVQAIDRIVDLLGGIATRPEPTGWFVDEHDVARVRCRVPDFDRLVDLAFVEIIRYGADSPQVTRRLRAAFDTIEAIVTDDRRRAVGRVRALLSGAETAALPAVFGEVALVSDTHGLG